MGDDPEIIRNRLRSRSRTKPVSIRCC